MTPAESSRPVQVYSAEKNAEFAAMTPAGRLAWLDEVRQLYFGAEAARGAQASRVAERLDTAAPQDYPRGDMAAGLTDLEWEMLSRLREGLPRIVRALERARDPETLRLILSGRAAMASGASGIPLEELWKPPAR